MFFLAGLQLVLRSQRSPLLCYTGLHPADELLNCWVLWRQLSLRSQQSVSDVATPPQHRRLTYVCTHRTQETQTHKHNLLSPSHAVPSLSSVPRHSLPLNMSRHVKVFLFMPLVVVAFPAI